MPFQARFVGLEWDATAIDARFFVIRNEGHGFSRALRDRRGLLNPNGPTHTYQRKPKTMGIIPTVPVPTALAEVAGESTQT